jgi:hypothetical protein
MGTDYGKSMDEDRVGTMPKARIQRLRAIAAVLEKVAIYLAMALLTYALIAVDTRAAAPSAPSGNEGSGAQEIRCGILFSSWIDSP